MFTAQKLKDLRKICDLTQRDLADKIGVARATVVAWENEKFKPEGDNLNKLAQALNTTVSFLIGESEIQVQAPKLPKITEHTVEKWDEQLTLDLAANDSWEQLSGVRKAAVRIFDAQKSLSEATSILVSLNGLTKVDAELLNWHLKYMEEHIHIAKDYISASAE